MSFKTIVGLAMAAILLGACGENSSPEAKKAYEQVTAAFKAASTMGPADYSGKQLSGVFLLTLGHSERDHRTVRGQLKDNGPGGRQLAGVVHDGGELSIEIDGQVFRGTLSQDRTFKAEYQTAGRTGQAEAGSREVIEGKFLDDDSIKGTRSRYDYQARRQQLREVYREDSSFYGERTDLQLEVAADGYRGALMLDDYASLAFSGRTPAVVYSFGPQMVLPATAGPGGTLLYPLANACFLSLPLGYRFQQHSLICRQGY